MEIYPKEALQLIYYENEYYFAIHRIPNEKPLVCKTEAITFVYPGGAV